MNELNDNIWQQGGGGGGLLVGWVAINPFTLRVPQESIVCYFHTFEYNLEIKQILTKYLKESCW